MSFLLRSLFCRKQAALSGAGGAPECEAGGVLGMRGVKTSCVEALPLGRTSLAGTAQSTPPPPTPPA